MGNFLGKFGEKNRLIKRGRIYIPTNYYYYYCYYYIVPEYEEYVEYGMVCRVESSLYGFLYTEIELTYLSVYAARTSDASRLGQWIYPRISVGFAVWMWGGGDGRRGRGRGRGQERDGGRHDFKCEWGLCRGDD